MAKKTILILGAGLAGLSAAWHLKEKGVDCRIFEKESAAGGLCRSKKMQGFTFDCDGHLLHFRHRYPFELTKSLLKDNLALHLRSSWIYSHRCYTPYPFQANLYGLPSRVIKDCILGFLEVSQRRRPGNKKKENFLEWIKHAFGEGISRHFMIPYNSKFWTVPPEELTCEWLDGFVPVPSLKDIVDGALGEGERKFGYNAHFWYPKKGGIGQLVSAFAAHLKNIHTANTVTRIDLDKREIELSGGKRERFDYLVSSIPLPEIPFLVQGLPSGIRSWFRRLRWNSILNLNLGLSGSNHLNRHWVYFPEKEVSFFRVGFYHNFSEDLVPRGKHSMYIETSYSPDRPPNKKKIAERMKSDLKDLGILSPKARIHAQEFNDIKYGYPIYDRNYLPAREKILGFLEKNRMFTCGRYGSWRYLSMADVIMEGRILAEKIYRIAR